LRAKERCDRWKEEGIILKHEAVWTVLFFIHMKDKWNARVVEAQEKELRGHEIYAEKQKAMWEMFADDARHELKDVR
jgi:hypothetical protein